MRGERIIQHPLPLPLKTDPSALQPDPTVSSLAKALYWNLLLWAPAVPPPLQPRTHLCALVAKATREPALEVLGEVLTAACSVVVVEAVQVPTGCLASLVAKLVESMATTNGGVIFP